MSDLENYIHHFFSISREDCQKAAALFRPEQIEKGGYYTKAGKLCDKMSFVADGALRVYAERDGTEVTQWISSAGYFITDISSFLFQTPTRFNIRALTDINLYTIGYDDYKSLSERVPKWNEFERLFIAKCFVMMENRIFDLISMTAEERYKQFVENNRELVNQVPQQYLASMLGMTPETFSRIRKKIVS